MPDEITDKAKPLVFISHKHANREIAEVIEEFVSTRSAGKVRVYLSSDPGSEGPGIGQNLTDALKDALWEASAVILVYTSAAYDWSYCMWECGVATDPKSKNTHIYVLQCGNDVPQPFADTVRVRAKSLDDIDKFTRLLLTDPGFFPDYGKITDFNQDSPKIAAASKELYEKLAEKLSDEEPNEWAAWPALQLEVGQGLLEEIFEAAKQDRLELAKEALKANATVIRASPDAPGLFGQTEFPLPMEFNALLMAWEEAHPGRTARWLDTVCEQLLAAARRGTPSASWELLSEVSGSRRFLPAMSEVRYVPSEKKLRVVVNFLKFSESQPVASVMTKLSKIRHEDMDKTPPETVQLKDLLEELEKNGWHRIPLVGDEARPRYIVHTSMIDKFIRKKAYANESIESLSLADLMDDPDMKKMFETTFVVVPQTALVWEAKRAMEKIDRCQDVFVTKNGSPDEPVLGWVTDRDIAESEAAS